MESSQQYKMNIISNLNDKLKKDTKTPADKMLNYADDDKKANNNIILVDDDSLLLKLKNLSLNNGVQNHRVNPVVNASDTESNENVANQESRANNINQTESLREALKELRCTEQTVERDSEKVIKDSCEADCVRQLENLSLCNDQEVDDNFNLSSSSEDLASSEPNDLNKVSLRERGPDRPTHSRHKKSPISRTSLKGQRYAVEHLMDEDKRRHMSGGKFEIHNISSTPKSTGFALSFDDMLKLELNSNLCSYKPDDQQNPMFLSPDTPESGYISSSNTDPFSPIVDIIDENTLSPDRHIADVELLPCTNFRQPLSTISEDFLSKADPATCLQPCMNQNLLPEEQVNANFLFDSGFDETSYNCISPYGTELVKSSLENLEIGDRNKNTINVDCSNKHEVLLQQADASIIDFLFDSDFEEPFSDNLLLGERTKLPNTSLQNFELCQQNEDCTNAKELLQLETGVSLASNYDIPFDIGLLSLLEAEHLENSTSQNLGVIGDVNERKSSIEKIKQELKEIANKFQHNNLGKTAKLLPKPPSTEARKALIKDLTPDLIEKFCRRIWRHLQTDTERKVIYFEDEEKQLTNLHNAVLKSNRAEVLCIVEIHKNYYPSDPISPINLRDRKGKTALEYAFENNLSTVVAYLKENGACISTRIPS